MTMDCVWCIYSFRDIFLSQSLQDTWVRHDSANPTICTQIITQLCDLIHSEYAIFNLFPHDIREAYPNPQAQVFTNPYAAKAVNKP